MTNSQENEILIIKRQIERLELTLNKFMNMDLSVTTNRKSMRIVLNKIVKLEDAKSAKLAA